RAGAAHGSPPPPCPPEPATRRAQNPGARTTQLRERTANSVDGKQQSRGRFRPLGPEKSSRRGGKLYLLAPDARPPALDLGRSPPPPRGKGVKSERKTKRT
ncbi:hypothetical protein IscW_ISCW015425, partial [Ixodes scapularis]